MRELVPELELRVILLGLELPEFSSESPKIKDPSEKVLLSSDLPTLISSDQQKLCRSFEQQVFGPRVITKFIEHEDGEIEVFWHLKSNKDHDGELLFNEFHMLDFESDYLIGKRLNSGLKMREAVAVNRKNPLVQWARESN